MRAKSQASYCYERGTFQSFEKAYEIFSEQRIFTDLLCIFLEIKRIFAKGVRDFLEVKCSSAVRQKSWWSLFAISNHF